MATYTLVKKENGSSVYIVHPQNLVERLKMAFYVLRYPDKVPVLMVVPDEWADSHIVPVIKNMV